MTCQNLCGNPRVGEEIEVGFFGDNEKARAETRAWSQTTTLVKSAWDIRQATHLKAATLDHWWDNQGCR